jgi:Tol biopolymer transport system component/predicted Ser/Thr protein kinase
VADASLGPYTILGELGRGGMGTVYRARDTRLRRDVALKMLPDASRHDAARRARLEQEARILAALTHPNIAAIYGIDESADGRLALVLELVEGQTLSTRLAGGALPIVEALTIARQIADALDVAHEKGVVHRDLKPGNIVITPAGVVKVLDFGIARMTEADQPVDETRTAGLTGEGTLAYMSPEQARGQIVDKRTDIWAFGCVLYEMLAGRRAFGAETSEPDWASLPAKTPRAVQRLLRRCLDTDARRRLRDIGDARADLDDAPVDADEKTTIASAPDARRRWQLAALVLAAGVIGALVGGLATRTKPAAAETVQYPIVPPDGYSFLPLAEGGPPALSPDGRRIAYVLRGPTGTQSLWVQSLGAFDEVPLPGTEGAAAPFWSPGSDELAFFADQKLKTIRVSGGAPRTLAEKGLFGSQGAMPGTWNRDGVILFDRINALWRVSARGGEAVKETEGNVKALDENHYGPYFLPDDRHYLFLVRGGTELQLTVMIGELGSSSRTVLLENVTSAQYAPGRDGRAAHLFFVRDRKLMARPFDDRNLALTGSEVLVANDVAVTGGGGLGDFSVSSQGGVAYRRGVAPASDMLLYDLHGTMVGAVGDRPGHPRNSIRFSPDGTSAAFTRAGPEQDVYIADLKTNRVRKFTTGGGRTPVWSYDGSEIAYISGNAVYRKKVEAGVPIEVWKHDGIMAINDWSGDGRHLLLTVWDTTKEGTTGRGLWLLSDLMNPSTPPVPTSLGVPDGHGEFAPPRGSARWITSDGVYVQSMPGEASVKFQVGSGINSRQARWRRSGDQLFLADGNDISVVDVTWTPTISFSFPRALFSISTPFKVAFGQWSPGWDVSPDGRQFVVTNSASETPATSIAIVTNWGGLGR